uniref:NADH dehydrogenase subunit 1 n=1 Tax=Panthera leo TaxID=9689 RepID=A0A8C8WCJ6_PANLE
MFVIHTLSLIVPILLAIAFLTFIKRKVLGYIQLVKGPNIVGHMAASGHCRHHKTLHQRTPLTPHILHIYTHYSTHLSSLACHNHMNP